MKKLIAMILVMMICCATWTVAVGDVIYEAEFADDFEYRNDERLSAYVCEHDDGSEEAFIEVLDFATITMFEHADGTCGMTVTEHYEDGDTIVFESGSYNSVEEFNNDLDLRDKTLTYIAAILLMN